MNVDISLIIPVYNMEKYLRRCLDSVMAQTYSDFEAILVDDGSTDSSGKICDEYAARDERFRVIHKENGGLCSARNCGMKIAGGGYIAFLDSDDEVEENYLASLMEVPSTEGPSDADLAVGGFRMLRNSDKGMVVQREPEKWETMEIGYACLERLFELKIFVFVVSKRFTRSIIQNNDLSFCEKFVPGEDAVFMAQYLSHCKKVCIVPTSGYLYYKYDDERRLTSSTKFYDPEKYFNGGNAVYDEAMRKVARDPRIERHLCGGHWLGVQYKINELYREESISVFQKIRLLDHFAKHREFGEIIENVQKTAAGDPGGLLKVCKTRKGWLIYAYLKAAEMKSAIRRSRK